MIAQLRQTLRALERPAGIDSDPGSVALGVAAIDAALGGGLQRGALHEVAAAGEVHVATAAAFALRISSSCPALCRASTPSERSRKQGVDGRDKPGHDERRKTTVWIAEDMALAESGVPYGPGLDTFGLAPERLLTVATAHTRDLLWTMEEALRCRAVGVAIGELRHGEIDMVALRRLSLAAAERGALAFLLRAAPLNDASPAATRWVVSGAPNDSFAVALTRNRRGPRGAWTLQWSDDDGFVLATPAQPVAAPAADRPHRKTA